MSVKLLTEHHLEFLSLKGGCTGSSESSLVKMSNCQCLVIPLNFDMCKGTPQGGTYFSIRSGSEVIKHLTCSTQLA